MAKGKDCTQEDLQYLAKNYGVLPDEEICRYLKRSPNALKIMGYRAMRINHKTNLISAREVARVMGVACSKTVIEWIDRGWLKGSQTNVRCGKNAVWNFTKEDLETFVRSFPWVLDRDKMQEGPYRTIVLEEFTRDPWCSLQEACSKVGVSYNSAALSQYLKKGWLHPVKVPRVSGNHWTWLFFKSDIDKFLAEDPRRDAIANRIKARKQKRLELGLPVEFCMVWKMVCKCCGKIVLMKTGSHMTGEETAKRFYQKYCPGGVCRHGDKAVWVRRPTLPYKVRKHKAVKKVNVPHWPARKTKTTVGGAQ
jgi:hypothetical protein